jgi:hypothetical protein
VGGVGVTGDVASWSPSSLDELLCGVSGVALTPRSASLLDSSVALWEVQGRALQAEQTAVLLVTLRGTQLGRYRAGGSGPAVTRLLAASACHSRNPASVPAQLGLPPDPTSFGGGGDSGRHADRHRWGPCRAWRAESYIRSLSGRPRRHRRTLRPRRGGYQAGLGVMSGPNANRRVPSGLRGRIAVRTP